MSAELVGIMNRLRDWAAIIRSDRGVLPFMADEADTILAALERAERLEKALIELQRRAADPTLREDAAGAWIMLGAALAEAASALEGRDG